MNEFEKIQLGKRCHMKTPLNECAQSNYFQLLEKQNKGEVDKIFEAV